MANKDMHHGQGNTVRSHRLPQISGAKLGNTVQDSSTNPVPHNQRGRGTLSAKEM